MSVCRQTRVFPSPPAIAPGLTRIPRQIAGFPEIRAALLRSIGEDRHAIPFAHWQAREGTDLGLMLLDMWAYLADILAFYDEVHAHETYVRTATQRRNLRRLVELLAYRPRPAVAATVELILTAQGRRRVPLPAGTAFRSGEVDGGPPQVFELNAPVSIHPGRNRWTVAAPTPHTLGEAGYSNAATALTFEASRSARWAVDDLVVVSAGDQSMAARVNVVEEFEGPDGRRYRKLTFDASGAGLNLSTALTDVRVMRPTQTAMLHTEVSPAIATQTLRLQGVIRSIRPGALVVITLGEQADAVEVSSTSEPSHTRSIQVSASPSTFVNAEFPYTEISLANALTTVNDSAQSTKITVHHGLVDAGTPTTVPADVLAPADSIDLAGRVRAPREDPGGTRFALADDDGQQVVFEGSIDYLSSRITPVSSSAPRPELLLPVSAFGNLAVATRGESIRDEILGSGDAAVASQSFILAKSPLTFLSESTSASGLVSTLSVFVDDRRWTEADSFFGVGPEEEVFVVRLDEDGLATITFGDGVRGARLPTGTSNVVAHYRFGAGASAPAADAIVQIARPMPGLSAVRQPLAAGGGDDAEDGDSLRKYAPRQALFLGRAVSIADFEAVAAAYPGVRAVRAGWAWEGQRQRTLVRLWYVGDPSLQGPLLARLQGVSDPITAFEVGPAQPVGVDLALEVEVAPDFAASAVEAEIADRLGDPDGGILAAENIGIGRRFRFSALRAQVHAVAGVVAVRMQWTPVGAANPVAGSSTTPGQGGWFDLVDSGNLSINGTSYALA